MMKTKLYITSLLLAAATLLPAQELFVSADIDSSTIWIGSQTQLNISVTGQADNFVQLPLFDHEIVSGLEVVALSIDTTQANGGQRQINLHYTITSFDDSLYYIPPFCAVAGNTDTAWSNALSLNVVQPFEIDTAQVGITDIKDIYSAPVNWPAIRRWVQIVWGIIGIALLLWGLIKYRRRKEHAGSEPAIIEPERPAYNVAIEQLDRLRAEKLWQQATQVKHYQSELTEVVRTYMDRIYGLNCMEMPSSEIIDEVKMLLYDKPDAFDALRKMLSTADLVKFAKWTATTEENEESLRLAYLFVNRTRPQEAPQPAGKPAEGKAGEA